MKKIRCGKSAIRDLYSSCPCILRCVICKENPPRKGKKTCGSYECIHRFFQKCVVPDIEENRICKTLMGDMKK